MAKKMQQSELDEPPNDGETEQKSTELIERYPTGCLSISVSLPPEQWPTSMEVGSARWQSAIVNSATTPDLMIGSEWSEVYMVCDWIVMVRESADEKTGEIRQYPWLSLICIDGSIIGTSSEIVPHQLARMLRVYTPVQWKAGIPVRLRRRQSRSGGRSYHEMRVVL